MRPPPTFRARQPCANSSRTFCSYRGSRYADCYSSARALFDWPRCPACRSTVSEPPVPIPQHRKRSAVLPPARNVPWDSPFSIASGNRVALFSQMFTGHIIEKALLAGAPLRNRTVDLLLTIHNSLGSLSGAGRPRSSIRPAGCCRGLLRGRKCAAAPDPGPARRGRRGQRSRHVPFRAGP
jgi:hypothetical protein